MFLTDSDTQPHEYCLLSIGKHSNIEIDTKMNKNIQRCAEQHPGHLTNAMPEPKGQKYIMANIVRKRI